MKALKLTTILLFIASLSFAQTATISYSQKVGGNSNDYFYKSCIAHNQLWSVGHTESSELFVGDLKDSPAKAWLYGCHMNGDSILSKVIDGSSNDYARDVIEGGVNNVIVVGNTHSGDGDFASADHYGNSDAFLTVIDTLGNFMYTQKYGGTGQDIIHRIIRTSSGNFLMVGQTTSNDGSLPETGSTDTDGWIYLLNESLDSVYSIKIGFIREQAFYDAIATDAGGYIVTGTLEPTKGSDLALFWVIKFNSLGEYQWEIMAGGSAYDRPSGLFECSDGNYMVYGGANSDDGSIHDHIGGADGFVVKFTPEGDTLWSKSLGWSDTGETISDVFEYNGKYYAAMLSSQSGEIDNYGESDIVLVEFDQENQNYVNHFGGESYDPASESGEICIQHIEGSEFFVSSSTLSETQDLSGSFGSADAWLFKIDVTTDNEIFNMTHSMDVYPNPATNRLHIDLNQYENLPLNYSILDIQGRVVQQGVFTQTTNDINIQALESGVYHLKTDNPYVKPTTFIRQ